MARVFVVDDEESIRYSFKHILSGAGYDVVTASHVASAIGIFDANNFDVAVVDRILTDGGNGIDIVGYIYGKQTDCATIMMSAYPSFNSVTESMKYDTLAYLTKPVTKKQLLDAVDGAIKKAASKKKMNKYTKNLHSVFDSAEEGVLIHDLFGKIIFANPSFKDLFGFDKENLVDSYIFDIYKKCRPVLDDSQILSDISVLVLDLKIPEQKKTIRLKNGRVIDFTLSMSVCRDDEKNVTGVLVMSRIITDSDL